MAPSVTYARWFITPTEVRNISNTEYNQLHSRTIIIIIIIIILQRVVVPHANSDSAQTECVKWSIEPKPSPKRNTKARLVETVAAKNLLPSARIRAAAKRGLRLKEVQGCKWT
uniref:Uncharacterized protein n=1 Tax=Anopheles merus TaxID=30066 RepID=A0A182URJ5_ANOME